MKITELVGGRLEEIKEDPYAILDGFSIFTTNEEKKLLSKLQKPKRLSSLAEHDQFIVQGMIRKSLITKIGMKDPMVVANEKAKQS